VTQLGDLADTLNKTNPHYVRCVKPNDVHMRPVDGDICFDAEKTYRQLMYAGVMEVCKIKKNGYPFRITYVWCSSVWSSRIPIFHVSVMCSSAKRENSNIFSFSCFCYVTQITRISLVSRIHTRTHTRKSILERTFENEYSNTHFDCYENSNTNARTQVRTFLEQLRSEESMEQSDDSRDSTHHECSKGFGDDV
jgi:hypothetical protein